VVYQNLSEADFAAALKSVGLPAGLADMLADSDVGASKGGLFDDSHTLSTLIGRPTTRWLRASKHSVIVTNWLFFVASPRVISDNEEMTHEEAHRARRTGTVY
jgi:hypothetical protein